jgi:hypothetical protein
MKKQELIDRYKSYEGIWDAPGAEAARKCFIRDLEQLEESTPGHADEAPRYIKNILARLRELPLHDREVWLKAIMAEFEQDFSHAIWREGYKQGKFEGEWVGIQLKDADKIRQELNKPVIPQFMAKWIEYCKFTHVDLQNALLVGDVYFYNYANQKDFSKLKEFLETGNNQDLFARAWLDGYTVEKEKRYVVTDGNHLYFKKYQEDVEIVILADEMPGTMDYVKKFDTKEEAREVANIFGWKVKEVDD